MLANSSDELELELLNWLVPIPFFWLLLKKKLSLIPILWLLAITQFTFFPSLIFCALATALAGLHKWLRTTILVMLALLSIAGPVMFLFSQFWYSHSIIERNAYAEVVDHREKGNVNMYIYAFNDLGAAGDYSYRVCRVRNLCPGVISQLILDARYSGHYGNLEIIDQHKIRYEEVDRKGVKTIHEVAID